MTPNSHSFTAQQECEWSDIMVAVKVLTTKLKLLSLNLHQGCSCILFNTINRPVVAGAVLQTLS